MRALLLVPVVLLLSACSPAGVGPVEIVSAGSASCVPGTEGDFAVSLKNHGPGAVTLSGLDFSSISGARVDDASIDGTPVDGYSLAGNGEVDVTVHLVGPGYVEGPELAYLDGDHQSFTAVAMQTLGFGTTTSSPDGGVICR